MTMKALTLAGLLSCMLTQTASAGFVIFNIRNATGSGDPAVSSPDGPGGYSIGITQAGQKVGLGSSDIDGTKLKDIDRLAITRTDDRRPNRLNRWSVRSALPEFLDHRRFG